MWIAIAIVVVVPICVIFFCIYFQQNIRAFIDRSKSIQGRGINIDASGKPQNPARTEDSSVDELMKAFDNPILKEQEQRIKADFKTRGVQNEADKIEILTRHLAATQIGLACVTIDAQIYGSQVTLLQFLNTKHNLPKERLKTFYDAAVSIYPNIFQNYSYEQYLAFLINWGLIIEKDNNFSITQFGVEFLSYLTKIKRNDPGIRYG
ncbi:MAG: hypothetical protein ACYS9C_17365 [Planctomycetota bacterium]|jgi:hypothetical protein